MHVLPQTPILTDDNVSLMSPVNCEQQIQVSRFQAGFPSEIAGHVAKPAHYAREGSVEREFSHAVPLLAVTPENAFTLIFSF